MYFYPHHIGDYRSATMHLSNEEDLAYRRLLEMYYDTETPIPDDLPLISKRIRVEPEALNFVLKEFFQHTSKGWKSKRCDLVINDYHEMAEKNRRNGQKGGRPKKATVVQENPVGSQSDTSGMPVVTQVKANHKPETINQEPKKNSNRGTRLPADFDLPDDWNDFCQKERRDLVPRKVFAEFKDYWVAQPGQKGVKTDWDATWRNWVRRQNAPRGGFVKPVSAAERETNIALGRPADYRMLTPEEQAERLKRIAMR
jgi:uncharacterized protein YdaU (DUF1376 family)